MSRFASLGALALATTLIATSADARGGRGRGGGGLGMGPRAMDQLDLTSEQKTEIERMRLQMQQELLDTKAALREKREELHALWQEDSPSKRAILAKHKEMDPLRNQIRTRKIDFRLAVHAMLTPEQRTKAQELKKQGKRRGGKGRRGGRGGGMGGGMGGGWGGDGSF